jgi:hypothetical protein
MDMPWKALRAAEREREYLALLTYLPLRSYSKIPRFFQFTFQIQRQLKDTEGAIGYALRAKPLSRKFWTLSVWESERALMDFVARVPHVEVMKSLSPHMERTKFTRWQLLGSALPPNWGDAMRRGGQEA